MRDEISKLFKGASKKIEVLAALTKSQSLTKEERESISFALLAIQYALRAEKHQEFVEYLNSWPPELPAKKS
jgi:uncharacterized membrane-anchored protein